MTAVRREIGDLLVDNGVITQEDLDSVREEHSKTGDSIVDILSKKGLANESQLQNALELEYGVNFVTLCKAKTRPDDSAVKLLSEEFMRSNKVVGISHLGDRLTLAMVDPSDSAVLAEVQNKLAAVHIKSVVCVEDDLEEFLDEFFGESDDKTENNGHGDVATESKVGENSGSSPQTEAASPPASENDGGDEEDSSDEDNDLEHLQGSGPGSRSKSPTHTRLQAQTVSESDAQVERAEEEAVVLLANQILGGAIKRSATHIHIIPGEREAIVHYRLNGGLVVDRKLPKTIVTSVINRYKIMAKLPLGEKACLDGHIKVKSSAKEIVCLVTIIPTQHGEHAVVWIV